MPEEKDRSSNNESPKKDQRKGNLPEQLWVIEKFSSTSDQFINLDIKWSVKKFSDLPRFLMLHFQRTTVTVHPFPRPRPSDTSMSRMKLLVLYFVKPSASKWDSAGFCSVENKTISIYVEKLSMLMLLGCSGGLGKKKNIWHTIDYSSIQIPTRHPHLQRWTASNCENAACDG